MLSYGCITIPTSENKVLSGEKITDKQLVFIEQGITSKSDIIDKLGLPDIHLIDKNIFAYDWQTRQAIMIWVLPGGAAGAADIPKNYVLLIRFDVEDIVRNHAITKRSLLESYGDHLMEWIQEDEKSE
jgi:outer membrane protein assembly factor BamE (lipoprotein component of BamABCDE complex)